MGQHLLYAGQPYDEPELHCWMRQGRASNAEVDYLLSAGEISQMRKRREAMLSAIQRIRW